MGLVAVWLCGLAGWGGREAGWLGGRVPKEELAVGDEAHATCIIRLLQLLQLVCATACVAWYESRHKHPGLPPCYSLYVLQPVCPGMSHPGLPPCLYVLQPVCATLID